MLTPLCTSEVAVKHTANGGEAVPVRCKRWSCPICAKINRRRVIAIAARSKARAMLTLTVSSKHYADEGEAATALKRGLRLLRLRLKRDEKLTNFEFMAIFERHKSGFPHLHLLITGKYIPWQKLQAWWKDITGSTGIDIRAIDTRGKRAFYVAKYLGKDLSPFEGCKRWWRSHGYCEAEALTDEEIAERRGWGRQLLEWNRLADNLRFFGWEVLEDGRRHLYWHPPRKGKPKASFDAAASLPFVPPAYGGRK